MQRRRGRVPVLYLAPWVDFGGADKGTLDWFRFIDRSRFAPSLITTQPSANRRLAEVEPYAEEVWELPQLMRGDDFPSFVFAFIESRGVELVHIMNSRLGFDLMPWMATLTHRPRVVVQLHVDEPDRSRYVQYVTTRYGNLVDAFSLSSDALSQRVAAHGVVQAKRRVIRTGVDAQREFCPAHVTPIGELDRRRLQIVFPARLTAQKDPLLMADVAARLRDAGVPFQIHVLGDGDLAEPLRRRISSLGLQNEVVTHGESSEVARWYAACDVVLLTSQFEGLPYVAYEAMAMGLPAVMPRLPGLDELVTSDTGVLVSDSRNAEPYAAALAELAAAPALRAQLGEAARERVLAEFSLERMGREHDALYQELLDRDPRRRTPQPRPNGRPASPKPTRVAFRGRRPGSRPLVSLIVPCFNHGAFLPECLDSIERQLYEPIETIVADDGSTDPETLTVLEQIERDRPVSLVRLPVNRGPGAARNAAIERATGRYVLPLDADNLLFPTAVGDLVAQLNNAGEQVGFVYPHLQYFGDRHDVRVASSYNLHALLASNFCDTASLIDREVFDRGLRYSEYDGLIHEDWEFVLALAERGIYGEPARNVTVLSRKRGFTRSDLVNLSSGADQIVARQHSGLLAETARIKAEWNPSLTVIALDPVSERGEDAVAGLVAAARQQSCADFELIIATRRELWPTELGRRLRRVSATLTRCRAEALTQGVRLARGGYVLGAYGSATKLLSDRTLIEKLLRLHEGDRELAAVALADASAGHPRLRLLDPDEPDRAVLGALCWNAIEPGSAPRCDPLPGDQPLEALARRLGFDAHVQWRQLSATGAGSPRSGVTEVRFAAAELTRRAGGFASASAMLPRCPPAVKAALGDQGPWMPPEARVLYRHLDKMTGRYSCRVEPDTTSDGGSWQVLGAIHASSLSGTRPLCVSADGAPLVGAAAPPGHSRLLGFIDQTELPLLDELSVGRHRETGQQVLIAGPADPLAGMVDDPVVIGFIEPCPIHPQTFPDAEVFYGLVGLVRTVDRSARRHRYGAGTIPKGVPAGELGSLLRDPGADCDPLWIDDRGSAAWPGHSSDDDRRPSLVDALQWTVAPMTWDGFSRPGPRLRSTARRAYDSAVVLAPSRPHRGRPATPAGYLLRSAAPYTVPLYGAMHPVTADRLLTTDPSEAAALGYRDARLLGHLVARAPITGQLGPVRPAAAWTTRFGMLTAAG